MGGLSGVLGHLNICDNVTVGAHTLITKDIKEAWKLCWYNARAGTKGLGKIFCLY